MFGLSLGHLLLLGIIVLIFVGPEQLPEVARTIARVLNELRRATADFQNQFTSSVDLKKWEEHLRQQGPPPQAHAQQPSPPGPVEHIAPPAAEATPEIKGIQIAETTEEPVINTTGHGYPVAPAGEAELPVGAKPVSSEEKKS